MIKRMRMFAGPNGSGKSTVKSVIEPNMLGYYLNPDDIEKAVKRDGYFDVRSLNIPISESEIITFSQITRYLAVPMRLILCRVFVSYKVSL